MAGLGSPAPSPRIVAQSLLGELAMPKLPIASFLELLALAIVGLLPSRGAAQTTTGTITVITGTQATELVDANGTPVSRSYVPTHPFWVNRHECEAGWQYQIGLTTDISLNGSVFEVWASNSGDCSQELYRYGGSAICWKVYYSGSWTAGIAGTTSILIPAQAIVGSHTNGGTDFISVAPYSADDCNPAIHAVASTGVAITLFFYAFSGANTGTPPKIVAKSYSQLHGCGGSGGWRSSCTRRYCGHSTLRSGAMR